jgi:hypothetical protein
MQWNVYDQRFPWVLWAHDHQGGFVVFDRRDGYQAYTADWGEVVRFAAQRSKKPGKTGLGTIIKGMTTKLGVEQCTPCAKRQIELDQMVQFPSSWDPFA